MSKPIPTEPPNGEKLVVFKPITLPATSKAGLPESPSFIGTSI
jgi:hypothetical protein